MILELAPAAAVGGVAGFVGAIAPGPAGLAILQRARAGQAAEALWSGVGAATVDAAACTALALGAGPFLMQMTAHAAARALLGLACAGVGLAIFLGELRRRPPEEVATPPTRGRMSYGSGLLRGLASPTTIVNWAVAIAALRAAGLLRPEVGAGLAFALGAGCGVVGWFAVLTRVVGSRRGGAVNGWLRAGTLVAAGALVLSGSIGALRVLGG